MSEWSDFENEVATAHEGRRRRGAECGVKRMLDALDSDARESIVKTLHRRELSAASIAAVLKRRLDVSIVPSWWTIGNHRRGGCVCPRTEDN